MTQLFKEHISYLRKKYSVSAQSILKILPATLITTDLSVCEGGVYNQSVTEEIFSFDQDRIHVSKAPVLGEY